MASGSTSYQPSRRSSPGPSMASGSRPRNQETIERRPPSTRGRSRSRSPPHQRWSSNPPGGWYGSPTAHHESHFGMRSETPTMMGRHHPSLYEHEDRVYRQRGQSEVRGRDNPLPTSSGQQAPESEHNWRTRTRSSPPAETRRTRGASRSLSPQGYRTHQGDAVGHEPYGWGRGRMDSVPSGERSDHAPYPTLHSSRGDSWSYSRTSNAYTPLRQQADEERGERTGGQGHDPCRTHGRYPNFPPEGPHRREGQGRLIENSWNNPQPRRDADRGPPVQNYGTVNNVGRAGNVLAAPNYGNIYMESVTVASAEEFMINLADRLKICARADHRYYAPSEEAALRRGECTPGTRVNIIQGVTYWAIDMSPGSERVYWLSGQAGAGKTTIAYTIARQLEAMVGHGSSRVILGASFFCSRQFSDTRSASSIIRTIVYQLALRSKSFQAALRKCGRFETINHGPRSQLMGLLVEPWESCAPERQATGEPCYVIPIDALDELEAEGGLEFLGTLFDVLEQQDLSGLKFFVTSRSHPALVRRIKSFRNKQVCRLEEVPLEESNADIKLYLNQNLGECATTEQIEQLVSDAAGLFIHAATVVEYLKGRDVGEKRSLLNGVLSTSCHAATATLDNLYLQILETSLVDPRDGNNPVISQDCMLILHTFLTTIERVSTAVAVGILNGSRCSQDTVLDPGLAEGVLRRLHAVLYSQGGLIMWFHKSFIDFLFDKGRSQRFFCNAEQHHQRLADGCFGVMSKQLRFNIANIPSSYQLDCDNPTLAASIDASVSRPLKYACSNWSNHLALASLQLLNDGTDKFLQLPALFWMEAMNLIGQRGRCESMLRNAQQQFSKCEDSGELVSKLADAAAFAAYHSTSKAALSTPHLYLSSLATFPRCTNIVQNWRRQLGRIPGFINARGAVGELAMASIPIGHRVCALAVSPDGINVLVGLPDGLVRIWDLSTGEEARVLKGHTDRIRAVAYSPRGTHAVSCSDDNSVRVWDLFTGEEVKVLKGHSHWVHAVAYSPNGAHVVSGSNDQSVRVWDLSKGEEVRLFKGHTATVRAVAYSPDGSHVVSGSADKSVRIWNLSTGEEVRVFNGHTDVVMAVTYSPNGTHIISGSADTSIRMWGLSAEKDVKVLRGHDSEVLAVRCYPDGSHAVSASTDASIRVWDLASGEEVKVLKRHFDMFQAVAYSADGTRVVSGSNDRSVRVWDLSAAHEARVLEEHTQLKGITAVAYSPCGTSVVSGSNDTSVRVWDMSRGEERNLFEGHANYVQAVGYMPDGNHIISGSAAEVHVWDLLTGQGTKVLEGPTNLVTSMAYSTNGLFGIFGCSDGSVRVWDISTGEEVKVFHGHSGVVEAVAYSPKGTHVVSGSLDGSVRVWDLSTRYVKVLRGHADMIRDLAQSHQVAPKATCGGAQSRAWPLCVNYAWLAVASHGH